MEDQPTEEYRPKWLMFTLKTWNDPFAAILDGTKRFEFRKDDRDFRVGDLLDLREWNPSTEEYSGRHIRAKITYMIREGEFGCPPGYCVMSIDRIFAKDEHGVRIFDDFGASRYLRDKDEWETYIINGYKYYERVDP